MQSHHAQRRISRAILAILCLGLLVAAATSDRDGWTSFMGDEATYLMQAESLAWDGDLFYGVDDYERFVGHWELPPQGLILQSGDGGATITYGKPFFYAAYLSPFLRLFDQQGPFIANALLLILCALVAGTVLERRLGPWAHLWTAALVFSSVVFASTFWIHADLFLMCLSALAFSLLFDLRRRAAWCSRRRWVISCAVVGGLLAIVVFSRPPYLPLLAVALWLLPRPRRGAALLTLGSAVLLLAGSAAVHHQLTGTWTPYGALRSGFYAHTGYPAVDFPIAQWTESVHEMGNAAARTPLQALQDRKLPLDLLAWNSLYFLTGRHVGVLIYFLPLLLIFLPGRRPAAPHPHTPDDRSGAASAFDSSAPRMAGTPQWWILAAVAVSVGLFLWTRPFNFYGGGGSLANRYFLPLFPALWFIPVRRMRLIEIVGVTGLAALFLFPLWQAPRLFPIHEQGTYRYVSPWAERLLPFETSQSHLRLAGRDDLYEGFYLRLVSPEIKRGKDGFLRLEAGSDGTMILGSILPLESVQLQTKSPPPPTLEVLGADLGEPISTPDGLWTYQLQLHRPSARHAMWWTWQPAHLYRVRLTFGAPGGRRAVFRLALPGAALPTLDTGSRDIATDADPNTVADPQPVVDPGASQQHDP